MIRATAGELSSIQVTPLIDQTYTNDTFDFVMFTSHSVLQGGSILVKLPIEMKLLQEAACSNFQAPLSAQASCTFFQDQSKL